MPKDTYNHHERSLSHRSVCTRSHQNDSIPTQHIICHIRIWIARRLVARDYNQFDLLTVCRKVAANFLMKRRLHYPIDQYGNSLKQNRLYRNLGKRKIDNIIYMLMQYMLIHSYEKYYLTETE